MSKVEVIQETGLTEEDHIQISTLLDRSFKTDFKGRSYFLQPHHFRVVWRDGQILGHAGLILRRVLLDDQEIEILGLCDVAVSPDVRKTGIASALVERAIEIARDLPVQFFALFGTENLYKTAGFEPVNNQIIWFDMEDGPSREIRRGGKQDLMVLELGMTKWNSQGALDLLGFKF